MAKRPYIDFQEVKEKCPIPEVLEKLGLLEQFKRKGDVLTGCCVLPGHNHGPQPNDQQFKVNKKDGLWLWHCFGDCQRGGDVIELVKSVKGFDNAHCRFWFAEAFGDRLSTTKARDAKNEVLPGNTSDEPPANEAEPAAPSPLRFFLNLDIDAAMPYLAARGIDEATAKRYGLGLCGKGLLNGYIAIPIYRWPAGAIDEHPVAYVGRWPGDDYNDDDRPRYKVPGEFQTSRVLFGLAQALTDDNQAKALLVVEGPLTAISLAQRGFSVVSSFTASLSDYQVELLLRTNRPIVLAFDGNEAGYNGMRTAAAKLVTHQFLRVVKLPEGKEPDELADDELEHFYGFARS